MARKVRLDKLLLDRGWAETREGAQERIATGDVLVDGVPVTGRMAQVDASRAVTLRPTGPTWVGRGALKLLGVLEPLGIDPAGRICADLGASTGGFTQVLLEKGALRVHAVDVGRNLLHDRVRNDPRVVVHEGVNARLMTALPDPISLVVGDLSFISLVSVLPGLVAVLEPGGTALLLVKPQFEVPRDAVEPGGVVRDGQARAEAIARVARAAEALGFEVVGAVDAPVAGARAGNVEHFLHLVRGVGPPAGC